MVRLSLSGPAWVSGGSRWPDCKPVARPPFFSSPGQALRIENKPFPVVRSPLPVECTMEALHGTANGKRGTGNPGMKILLINQCFYPDVVSSAQHLTDLALELASSGHEVTVLTGRRGYDDPSLRFPKKEIWKGITVFRIPSTGL